MSFNPEYVKQLQAELFAANSGLSATQQKLKAEIEAHGATITREAQLSLKLEAAEARIAKLIAEAKSQGANEAIGNYMPDFSGVAPQPDRGSNE